MSPIDWRLPAQYEDLRSLDAPGLAWEYLCRNADFATARKRLESAIRRGALKPAEADDFARRWGVRFRGANRRYRSDKSRMDGVRPAQRRRSSNPSSRSR
jgi:hypothetical protein